MYVPVATQRMCVCVCTSVKHVYVQRLKKKIKLVFFSLVTSFSLLLMDT